MHQITDIPYTSGNNPIQRLDLYLPDTTGLQKPNRIFLYLHGGGLEGGDKADAAGWAESLTRQGIAVASANYRMYPGAHFPEFIQDCAQATAWLIHCAGDYLDPVHLFVGGSSAGAYLSMMLCFDSRYLAAAGVNPNQVDGYVLDAGQPTTHYNVLRERGLDTRLVRIDEAAPLYFLNHDLVPGDRQPRFLIFTADQDIPGRYEQTLLMMETMRQFGYDSSLLQFHYMTGYQHTQYTGGEFFCQQVSQFILADM